MSFLDIVSKHIEQYYSDSPEDYCIVLPNRRSGLFLRQKLAKIAANKHLASFIPAIFSIEEYIYRQSGLDAAEELTLLSLLYKSYRKILGTKAFEFDRFYSSGRLIINDFSDVDDYLADPENVFEYLFRIKEIEGWFPDEADSEIQKNYLEFYKALKEIYFDFRKTLLENALAYRGLASRQLAENGAIKQYKKVCFAGLNALSPSFEKHISNLMMESKADILWDYDPMYLDNEQHEAGYFLRKARRLWPHTFDKNVKSYFEAPKQIDIIGAPYQLSQIQTGLQLLQENLNEGKDTLMVLADEDMLTPLLYSLPESISDKVNISMGISVRDTFCGQLIQDTINLHLNPLRVKLHDRKSFYYYDLRKFLSNPLLPFLMKSQDTGLFFRLKNDVMENPRKIMFADFSEPAEVPTSAQKLGMLVQEIEVMQSWQSWLQMCDVLENACHKVFQAAVDDAKLYQERESAWKLMTAIQSIRNIFAFEEDSGIQQIGSVANFIKRSISELRVPLKGEPLTGIQILGLLETRALDFDHVIVLGVNEGFLPKSSHNDSFIPFDVRRELKLPLPYHTEAVFAYHFYRLLQRSKTVKLVYNTEPDPIWGKEPSRYLAQLEHEISRQYPNLKLTKSVLEIRYSSPKFENMPLPERNFIEKRLEQINEEGFSFSALKDFLQCPYKFALARILKIPEAEKDPFEPDSSKLGTVFHSTMEALFKDFLGKQLAEKDLDIIIAKAESEFFKQIEKEGIPETDYGTMFLATEVIRDSLMRYLRQFKSDILKEKIFVEALEEKLDVFMQLSDGLEVKLIGYADRIEKRDGTICVMDFKTTGKKPEHFWTEDLEFDMVKHEKMMQLLYYAMLYMRKEKSVEKVKVGNYIILTKNNSTPYYVLHKKNGAVKEVTRENLYEIEEYYRKALEDLYDEEQQFLPMPSKNVCKYCPYKNVLCFSYEE